jgi:ABC-2 type transport system ATP-binding protein
MTQWIGLRSLTKEFGPQVAVRKLDLDIPAGQLVGLLGPNDAGFGELIACVRFSQKPPSVIQVALKGQSKRHY